MNSRFVLYLQAIPNDTKSMPKMTPVFFCRNQGTVNDVLEYLNDLAKAGSAGDANPRRSRQIAVVSIDEKVFDSLPEGRRPETMVGDVFPSIKHAAKALGVSRTYIHRKLSLESTENDLGFPSARIKGVTIAFVDDIPV